MNPRGFGFVAECVCPVWERKCGTTKDRAEGKEANAIHPMERRAKRGSAVGAKILGAGIRWRGDARIMKPPASAWKKCSTLCYIHNHSLNGGENSHPDLRGVNTTTTRTGTTPPLHGPGGGFRPPRGSGRPRGRRWCPGWHRRRGWSPRPGPAPPPGRSSPPSPPRLSPLTPPVSDHLTQTVSDSFVSFSCSGFRGNTMQCE